MKVAFFQKTYNEQILSGLNMVIFSKYCNGYSYSLLIVEQVMQQNNAWKQLSSIMHAYLYKNIT